MNLDADPDNPNETPDERAERLHLASLGEKKPRPKIITQKIAHVEIPDEELKIPGFKKSKRKS